MKNENTVPYRPVSVIQCYLAYISALLIAPIAWWYFQKVIENQLWVGFVVTCASTFVIWIYSVINNNSSIYDPYWVIAPPILASVLLFVSDGWDLRKIIIVGLFWVWGFRYHIFYSWSGWRTGLAHEDWRYENMRSAPIPYWLNSLLGMHLFPTILVYFAFIPAALVLLEKTNTQPFLGVWDLVGISAALLAISIEYVSDRQLGKYRETEEYKKGGTLRQGLWSYSRHPNYFGEVLFWLSMIPFTVSSGIIFTQNLVLVLTGPLLMGVFFRFSSWLTDIRSLERRPGYKAVMNEVSAMIPWMPKKCRIEKRRLHCSSDL